ncbi:zinc dependent phospholipase C family protein [Saliterribacillus persicus]|uniref:Zinc dependent phospholipase C n=1 Tax=Saliterribacillus persicus TaxID=930114 RepID=A0A368XR65_9BACI|nr:zinc dependent phospholipase C family protein [Saliterribacillus persicus]RCW69646.1 zinc dependent phospholipase C [Saliterribacillus persicus]
MPNIWTHILFCEDVLDAVNAKEYKVAEENYLNLGAQGPDPFFYHHFLPWKNESKINQLGTVLHTEKCGDFLMELIIQAQHANKNTKAYVFGFFTHHILDRNTHPYIHYRAGYEKNKHQKLEVIIDTLFMQGRYHLKTWKTPVCKSIDVGMSCDKNVYKVMNKSMRKIYSEETKELSKDYLHLAYKDMKHALQLLYDPIGWKNFLLGNLISPFSHQPISDNLDYLNKNHKEWRHPATDKPSSKSFLDLYDKARTEGIEIGSLLMEYWENPSTNLENKLRKIIDNYSYDTGLPLKDNASNKYSDPIV